MSVHRADQLIDDFRQKPLLLAALLLLAVVLLYSPVSHYGFIQFDDFAYVSMNPHVRTGLNSANLRWAFTTFEVANWHPVTWLSLMLDCQIFGLDAPAHHLVNVALHAANVLLLFFLLQRGTGAVWRSFFVATLFAVHPLNVETVAWVAERKSLLCTLFSLLTIAAYAWNVRRPTWKRYLLVIAAFALALMSKPMAVTLPLALLLLDYWPFERYSGVPFLRKWWSLAIEKLPLFLMSAASAVMTMVAAHAGGAFAETAALPILFRIENAALSCVAYIGKTFWPARLSIFYPFPQFPLPLPNVIASIALLAAITLAVLYFHRSRYLVVGWMFFLITLIPVIGIVQVGRQAMADRYTYVPCIGLFVIIAWGLAELASASRTARVIAPIAALCFLIALATATTRYLNYWQDGVKLFTHASEVAVRPDLAIEEALADALVPAGQIDAAFQHYSNACELNPAYASCHYYMAEILYHRRQLQDALEQYQLAAKLAGNREMALSSLINSGRILLSLGDYHAASTNFAAALQIDPGNHQAAILSRQALSLESNQSSREPAHAPPSH